MMRVMVVEDEEMIRKGIVMAVDWAALDCIVVGEAANGEQALAVAEDCQPTLIITDLKMPKMDGLEMVRRLREAKAVHAEKLAFLTDIEGLYKDINDKSTFISRLTASEAEGLIHDGYIGGGMLPKLNNCTSAIRNGVNRVHILDGRLAHCLLLEIFTNQGIGTAIVSDEEE